MRVIGYVRISFLFRELLESGIIVVRVFSFFIVFIEDVKYLKKKIDKYINR